MKLEPHYRCADAGGYACTCGADKRNELIRLNDRIAKLENVAKAARDYANEPGIAKSRTRLFRALMKLDKS